MGGIFWVSSKPHIYVKTYHNFRITCDINMTYDTELEHNKINKETIKYICLSRHDTDECRFLVFFSFHSG